MPENNGSFIWGITEDADAAHWSVTEWSAATAYQQIDAGHVIGEHRRTDAIRAAMLAIARKAEEIADDAGAELDHG